MKLKSTQNGNLEVSEMLGKVNCTEYVKLLKKNNIFISRRLRMDCLLDILQDTNCDISRYSIFKKDVSLCSANEHILETIFDLVCSKNSFEKYKVIFWKRILNEHPILIKKDLMELSFHNPNNQTFIEYNNCFNEIIYDEKYELDGIKIKSLIDILETTYKEKSLYGFLNKYEIKVSNRIRKDDYLDLLKMKLKEENHFCHSLGERLNKKTIQSLERYSKKYRLDIPITNSISECVYFIRSNIKEILKRNQILRVSKVISHNGFRK